jgi:hypothetical protein
MTRFEIILGCLITAAIVCLMIFLMLAVRPAHAHDPYTGKIDSKFKNGCCGGSDCAVLKVKPGMLTGEGDDLRLRMTLEEAREINPYRAKPVDTIITYDRVQDSWDGNYHVCLRTHDARMPSGEPDTERGSVYCFWAPGNT